MAFLTRLALAQEAGALLRARSQHSHRLPLALHPCLHPDGSETGADLRRGAGGEADGGAARGAVGWMGTVVSL